MIEFTDIQKNLPNGDNMGGISQKVYYGFYADVHAWPTKPLSPATMETACVLTGDLKMKTGKRLFELYLTDDTGEFKVESVGELDGKSFVQHLNFFHPGMQKKIVTFMNATKNDNMVFICMDNDGQTYLMGDALRPAVFAGSKDGAGTGATTAARKGSSFEFTFKTPSNYIYTGNIPLTIATSGS
jgi:hypothetical protein